jgi:hypothetical protein
MAEMKLGEKQRIFTILVAQLIEHAYSVGYELRFGEAYRTPEQAALNAAKGIGIKNSVHTKRLAVDFNLFKDSSPDTDDDIYQTDSAAYKELGAYWKTLHPLCRWGGDFKRPDGNHFSMEHEGVC